MSIAGYKLPLQTGRFTKHEVKRVKILTGKYKGEIKDFCHYTDVGKVVVRIGAGHRLVYNVSSVEFVESVYIFTPEIING